MCFFFFEWKKEGAVTSVVSSTPRSVIVMDNTTYITGVLLILLFKPLTKWNNLKTPIIKPCPTVIVNVYFCDSVSICSSDSFYSIII